MKEVDRLLESLHPLERTIIPSLRDSITARELVNLTELDEVEVLRALQWLESKNVLKQRKETRELIVLDKNGQIYLEKGLPERRFMQVIKDTTLTLNDIKEKASLDKDELTVSLGLLKKKNAIKLDKKISITNQGKSLLLKEFLEEIFLGQLPLDAKNLTSLQKQAYSELKKRRSLVKSVLEKTTTVKITELGRQLLKREIKSDMIDSLTPQIIKSQEWVHKKFRRYNVAYPVPRIHPGKRHFVNQAIHYIKRIWLELGFKEMQGPLLESSFWNFDSLFVPQDHPARDMQSTFFVKSNSSLPSDETVRKVKEQHENVWKYKFNVEESKHSVLRTHTTSLSAQTISQLKKTDLPAKFFAVGKVFRNEALDWAHLFEFNQTEGIVIDENVNLRHLIGYLKEYYKKLGFEKIRIVPSYFPYTSPSIEIMVYNPVKDKWVEMGGAGILRPEVVIPLLGHDIPVLAWGQGLERNISDYYKITDLRNIYKNDLKYLRETRAWLK
ncbi:phenylalanine--tRNA ligase subunit alpha [Candidatus Woesearchaeota archaeon]|nr:phenylalanine--tRNA ligase subunit alpha [Candidatus Woesearchaeota archaeon]